LAGVAKIYYGRREYPKSMEGDIYQPEGDIKEVTFKTNI